MISGYLEDSERKTKFLECSNRNDYNITSDNYYNRRQRPHHPRLPPWYVCPTFNPANSVARESLGTMSRVCVCVSVYACLCVYMRVRACVHGLVSAVAAVGVDCSWSWELVGCWCWVSIVCKSWLSFFSRGFGFVTYRDPASVEKVLASGPHLIDSKTVQ